MYSPNSLQPYHPEHAPEHGRDVLLHNSEIEISGDVLYGREEAVAQWGINGDVLAVIKMPGNESLGNKNFAIVDYGLADETPYAFAKEDGPFTFMGKSPSRYAVVGLTHKPNDLIVAFSPLETGETSLGRNYEHHNYLLGLAPNEENVDQISRQHVTLTLSEAGRINVSDHSTNGTTIEMPELTENTIGRPAHLARPFGAVALNMPVNSKESSNPKGLNLLESAKAVFTNAGVNDLLMGNVPGMDTLLSLMKPEEREAFQSWQMEQAARRTPNMWEIIRQTDKNDYGIHEIPENMKDAFAKSLEKYGVRRNMPTDSELKAGIAQATRIVDSDQAVSILQNESFMEEYEFKRLTREAKKASVNLQTPLYVDPELIRGAGGFDSWAGRGRMGLESKSYARANGQPGTGISIDAITDYATRDTQLPKMEMSALCLIITNEGPVFYASVGAHRTAAAKLRGEPIRFSSMKIFDAR